MIYVYENPETGEQKEVLQGVNDTHTYSEDGVRWNRVWTAPQIGVDTKVDPFSNRQFIDKTARPGTIGDMLDRSAELSHLRAEKNGGLDPVKAKADKEYEKKRPGISGKKVDKAGKKV